MAHLEWEVGVKFDKFKNDLKKIENAAKDMVDKVVKNSEQLDSMLAKASSRAKSVVDSFEKLDTIAGEGYQNMSNMAKTLAKELETASATMTYVSEMQEALNKELAAGTIESEDYATAMGGLQALRDAVGATIIDITEALNNEAASMDMDAESVEMLRLRLTALMGQLQTLTDEQKNEGLGEVLSGQISEIVNQLGEVSDSVDDALQSIVSLGKNLRNIWKSPAEAIKNLPDVIDNFKDSYEKMSKLLGNGAWKTLLQSFLATEEGALIAAAGVAAFGAALVAGGVAVVVYKKEIEDFLRVMLTGHKVLEDYEERLEAIRDATEAHSADMAKEVVKLKGLAAAWAELNTQQDKAAFVQKYKSEFEALGIAIYDVGDAERILSDATNTNKVIESLMIRTQATAAAELAETKLKDAIEKRIKAEKKIDKASSKEADIEENLKNGYASGLPDVIKQWSAGVNRWRAKRLKNASEDLQAESQNYITDMQNYKNQVQAILEEMGIDMKDYDDKTAEFIQSIKKMSDALEDARDKNDLFGLSGASLINAQLQQTKKAINAKYIGAFDESISKEQREMMLAWRDAEIAEAERAAKNQLRQYNATEANAVKSYEENISAMLRNHAEARVSLVRDLQNQINEAKLDSMENGNAKELAKMDNDYELVKQKIEQQRKDYVDTIVKQQKELFDAQENEKARKNSLYVKGTFDENAARNSVDTGIFDTLSESAKGKYMAGVRDFYQNLKNEYETYEQAIERINKKYDDDIAAMRKADGSFLAGFSEENVTEAEKKRKNELDKLYAQFDETYKRIFKDVNKMSKESIREALNAAKAWVSDKDNKNSPLMADMQKRVDELQDAFDSFDWSGFEVGWEGIANRVSDIIKLQSKLKDKTGLTLEDERDIRMELERQEGELQKALLATGIDAFANVLGNISGTMSQIADIVDSGKMRDMANAVGVVSQTISGAVSGGASSGSWWGALAGALLGLGGALSGLGSNATLAKEEWKALMKEFSLLDRFKLDGDKWDSIFGTTEAARAAEAYNVAQKALNRWNGMRSQLMKEAVTIHGKNNNATLAELDIWDSNGMLDIERARRLLESEEFGRKANDGVRKALAEAVTIQQAYIDAMDVVDDYIGGLFSNVADDLTNAIWDGVENGTDAWDNFQDTASDTIRNIAKQMVKEMFITKMAKDWQTKLEAAVETDDSTMIQTFTEFIDSLQTYIPEAMDKAKQLNDIINNALGESVGEDSAATAKGIAQASQDSIDELNGRLSAIQTHTYTLNENVKSLLDNSTRIEGYFTTLLQHTGNLELMREYLYRIEASTDKMATKGVTML